VDLVLTEFQKYRVSLAVLLETSEHMASLEENDISHLKAIALELLNEIDLQIIADLVEKNL
jgi:hypothetical protein